MPRKEIGFSDVGKLAASKIVTVKDVRDLVVGKSAVFERREYEKASK